MLEHRSHVGIARAQSVFSGWQISIFVPGRVIFTSAYICVYRCLCDLDGRSTTKLRCGDLLSLGRLSRRVCMLQRRGCPRYTPEWGPWAYRANRERGGNRSNSTPLRSHQFPRHALVRANANPSYPFEPNVMSRNVLGRYRDSMK